MNPLETKHSVHRCLSAARRFTRGTHSVRGVVAIPMKVTQESAVTLAALRGRCGRAERDKLGGSESRHEVADCRRQTAGRSSRVLLYLDYDGVLHPEDVVRHPRRGIYLHPKYVGGHVLFEHAGLLAEELEQFPDVGIVLSTSWVRVLSFKRALGCLPEALRKRVVGATYHSSMDDGAFLDLSRGQQVVGDAGRRKAKRWLALDDDAEHWPVEHRGRLLHTHPVQGLASVLPQFRERLRAVTGLG